MTPRTAQRYMSAAAVLGDKSDIVSFLPPTTIYQLAAPSMPPPVREEIVERMENERLAPATVEKIVREAKDETRRQRALAKMSAAERKAAERKAKRSRATREQREAEAQRRQQEWEADEQRRERATTEVAELIKSRMGDDLPRFVSLLKRTYWGPVERALTASEVENGA